MWIIGNALACAKLKDRNIKSVVNRGVDPETWKLYWGVAQVVKLLATG